MNAGSIIANRVDIKRREIVASKISWSDGVITSVQNADAAEVEHYVIPGFVDSHVHIESSLLVPSQFARVAVRYGTIATISDPHEIANVCGIDGVRYMIQESKRAPMKTFYGAPSCVPATTLETAGAAITSRDVAMLLDDPDIHYLAEMMNWPGVLGGDAEVLQKIDAAKSRGMPVDGHAPNLVGQTASAYFAAGITADHESTSLDEAVAKAEMGVMVQIRQGSAARNFDALWPMIDSHAGRVAFCSDDKHADELMIGHIDSVCRLAIEKGCDVFNVLLAACVVPIEHYGLPVGQLRVGDPADFVVLDSLETFRVEQTVIDGEVVYGGGKTTFEVSPAEVINSFSVAKKSAADFEIPHHGATEIRVIDVHDGQLTTSMQIAKANCAGQCIAADLQNDHLPLTVVNRYHDAPPAMAMVHGFGMASGAIASSVGHDSHNILAVGVDAKSISIAVNAVIDQRGGLVSVDGSGHVDILPLPVAGLMSTDSGEVVAAAYERLDAAIKSLGCPLRAPYMTLSFLALLVIPSIKLSDKGLFDAESFEFLDLRVD